MLLAVLTLASLAVALLGCGRSDRSDKDLSEIRDTQRKILSRLADLEKKIDRIASRPGSPQRAMGPDPARTYNLPVEGSPVKGPADAPITIVEFSDYQCPFCARSEGLIDQALAAYPKQARFTYKHFPLTSNHPQALPAALAAVAAQKQGKFWEMHEILFANQQALSNEQIEQYARKIGLDMARFKKDIDSEEVKAQVEDDRQPRAPRRRARHADRLRQRPSPAEPHARRFPAAHRSRCCRGPQRRPRPRKRPRGPAGTDEAGKSTA